MKKQKRKNKEGSLRECNETHEKVGLQTRTNSILSYNSNNKIFYRSDHRNNISNISKITRKNQIQANLSFFKRRNGRF